MLCSSQQRLFYPKYPEQQQERLREALCAPTSSGAGHSGLQDLDPQLEVAIKWENSDFPLFFFAIVW